MSFWEKRVLQNVGFHLHVKETCFNLHRVVVSKLSGNIPKDSVPVLEKNMKIQQADILVFLTTEDPV